MSESTPADLANAFRSFARREAEARRSATGASVSSLSSRLSDAVQQAAALVGASGGADAVAAAIDARDPQDWDDETLTSLRSLARDAGSTLQSMSAEADRELGDSEGSSDSW